MNVQLFAANIARKIPEMANDSPINNTNTIANLLDEELAKDKAAEDQLQEEDATTEPRCPACRETSNHFNGHMHLCGNPTCRVYSFYPVKV